MPKESNSARALLPEYTNCIVEPKTGLFFRGGIGPAQEKPPRSAICRAASSSTPDWGLPSCVPFCVPKSRTPPILSGNFMGLAQLTPLVTPRGPHKCDARGSKQATQSCFWDAADTFSTLCQKDRGLPPRTLCSWRSSTESHHFGQKYSRSSGMGSELLGTS